MICLLGLAECKESQVMERCSLISLSRRSDGCKKSDGPPRSHLMVRWNEQMEWG